MEIKIVDKISGGTHIFEGNEIFYDFTKYENLEEYRKLFLSTDKFSYLVCTDPDKVKDFPGYILYISFQSNGDLVEMKINDSIIYITNKGQTIDKINC
jgi:hypothetical protein